MRARLVRRPADYLWSSAIAHVTGGDGSGLLDMDWWRRAGRKDLRQVLDRPLPSDDKAPEGEANVQLRACTFAGRPFGNAYFVDEMASTFGRHWNTREGRPSKKSQLRPHEKAAQFPLFQIPSKNNQNN